MSAENEPSSLSPINSNVWAIVANYNGAQWIRACLSSLTASSYPLHILVVDNQSTRDNSIEIIENEFPGVKLIQSPSNLGFGRANNEGIKIALRAGADCVFLLNQDAWIEKDTIEKLVNISRQYPEYGIVSPVHFNVDKSALDYGFSVYIRPDKCPGFISDVYTHRLRDLYALPLVNAAAWLITRSCLETVGGFDPLFFMYGEDVDFCDRVLFHRFRIGVAPEAEICHARESKPLLLNKRAPLTLQERFAIEGSDLALLKNVNKKLIGQFSLWTVQSGIALSDNVMAGNFARAGSILGIKLKVLSNVWQVILSRQRCKARKKMFL